MSGRTKTPAETLPTDSTYHERELITRIANGDGAAFKTLFDKYYTPLSFFANGFTNSLPEAEDVVQDVFYKIWNRREELSSVINPKAYLYTAIRNSCLDLIKNKKLETSSQEELRKRDSIYVNQAESALVLEEVLQLVINEIQLLPEKYRTVVELVYLEGLDYRQVSERLQIPEATIRKQKERAVDILRSELLKKHLDVRAMAIISLFFY